MTLARRYAGFTRGIQEVLQCSQRLRLWTTTMSIQGQGQSFHNRVEAWMEARARLKTEMGMEIFWPSVARMIFS